MIHRLLASSILLGASALCATAQTSVLPYQPGITPAGITYFLPKTSVRFVIKATRTHYTPGQFANYAERYLNVTDAPQMPYDVWSLDDISVVPFGTADTSQAYTIALNPKSTAPLVTLTPDGRLLAINTEVAQPGELPTASVTKEAAATLNPNDYFTTDMLRATSIAKKAELAAQEIYDLRENRSLIAKGQADFNPTDGTQLQLMLTELDKNEHALTMLFTGSSEVEHHTFVLDCTPEKAVNGDILFRFSRHLGLVDSDDLAGEPYILSIVDETTLPSPVVDPKAKPKEMLDVRYRIPGRARISLFTKQQTVFEVALPVAQFGRTEHLGGELFVAKKAETHVKLNAVTGNVEHIESLPIGK